MDSAHLLCDFRTCRVIHLPAPRSAVFDANDPAVVIVGAVAGEQEVQTGVYGRVDCL